MLALAEEHLGIPALIDPKHVSVCGEPNALLLYLSHFRSTLNVFLPPRYFYPHHSEVGKSFRRDWGSLWTLRLAFSSRWRIKQSDNRVLLRTGEQPVGRRSCIRCKASAIDERFCVWGSFRFLCISVFVLSNSQCISTIHEQEEQNQLLETQNRVLLERVAALEKSLRLEQSRRAKAEERLNVEELIKAHGELLTERGALDYLGLYEKKAEGNDGSWILAAVKSRSWLRLFALIDTPWQFSLGIVKW